MKKALSYLSSLGLHRVKPGLERIENILQVFGNPQHSLRHIIVAGTNGKGSVAATIASVLTAQGYRVGLYTSPHLVRINERIKVKGEEIPSSVFSRLIIRIKDASETLLTEEPSYFETITAAAFLYFASQEVDFTVLEVGMGGKWDATNIVSPLVSVITNISKDHTEFLGNTIKEITYEKAGVIKRRVPVVTSTKREALRIIRTVTDQLSSPLIEIDKDYRFTGESTGDFTYVGKNWKFKNLCSNLRGLFQLENISTAIATLETLSDRYEVEISEKNLRDGLSSVEYEGRMEIVRENPPLILDGAHNSSAARALTDSLKIMFPSTEFVILMGMLRGKDHGSYIREILKIAESVIFTEVPSERGDKPEKLAKKASRWTDRISIIKNYKEAYEEVRKMKKPVCITGSLYLVGGVKSMLSDNSNKIKDWS